MKTQVPEKYSHLIESGKFAPHGSPFDRGGADSYYSEVAILIGIPMVLITNLESVKVK